MLVRASKVAVGSSASPIRDGNGGKLCDKICGVGNVRRCVNIGKEGDF